MDWLKDKVMCAPSKSSSGGMVSGEIKGFSMKMPQVSSGDRMRVDMMNVTIGNPHPSFDKTAGGNSENPPVPAGMQASPGEGFGARTPTVISNRSQFLISHF